MRSLSPHQHSSGADTGSSSPSVQQLQGPASGGGGVPPPFADAPASAAPHLSNKGRMAHAAGAAPEPMGSGEAVQQQQQQQDGPADGGEGR
mmetsp:Transcript_21847/g.56983  ORF Transcript_21847/g.56983 Transcript_21847/m.56983 type:complete len:91 (+) Transcript_21847:145-417(+)